MLRRQGCHAARTDIGTDDTIAMPTVLTSGSSRFFFYSAVGDMAPHVWVHADGHEAMVWLHDLSVASNRGYAEEELHAIVRTVSDRRDQLLRAWHEHFGLRVV